MTHIWKCGLKQRGGGTSLASIWKGGYSPSCSASVLPRFEPCVKGTVAVCTLLHLAAFTHLLDSSLWDPTAIDSP